ncbi:GVQW3 protein, partial [Pseudoatta argentina]
MLEEVDFEEIMDQEIDSDKEILSDDSGYASDLSEHDTDYAERFVPCLEIPCMISLANTDIVGMYLVRKHDIGYIDALSGRWNANCWNNAAYSDGLFLAVGHRQSVVKIARLADAKLQLERRKLIEPWRFLEETECYKLLKVAYGENSLSRARVFEWYKRFSEGRESTEDDQRPGRPVSVSTPQTVTKILDAMHAGCHIKVPWEITTKRAVISVRRTMRASVLYPTEKYTDRKSLYLHYTTVLNLTNIEFPVTLKNISKFERLNAVSINVYGIELRLTLSNEKKEKHINVLYMQDPRNDGVGHFAWIKNLFRLVSSQISGRKNKKFFCDR